MNSRWLIFGISAWLALIVLACAAVQTQFRGGVTQAGQVAAGIGRWLSGVPEEHSVTSGEYLLLAPGDPVFAASADGTLRQVGHVRNHFGPTKQEAWTKRATVVLYTDISQEPHFLEYCQASTSLESVFQGLMTPERQRNIAKLIADDWNRHQVEVLQKLQPVLEKSLAKSLAAIEAEVPETVDRHRADFARLADRWQSEIVRSQIVPLVRTEILPIVQEEVRPVAMSIGKELWSRVSLWSFTWRYLYDVSPLPEKNRVKAEFDRFLKEEVTPVLEQNSDDFVSVTEKILRRISRNEKVRTVVRENLRKATTDKELHQIVWSVFRQLFIGNEMLQSTLQDYWSSPEARAALDVASARFEPTARAIGDAVFGSRERGVTAEFARALRTQILMKDRRWLILVKGSVAGTDSRSGTEPSAAASAIPVIRSNRTDGYPLRFEGTLQSPLTHLADPAALSSDSAATAPAGLPIAGSGSGTAESPSAAGR